MPICRHIESALPRRVMTGFVAMSLALAGAVVSAPKAQAEMLFTAAQNGTEVDFTISGEVNTSILTNINYGSGSSGAVFYGYVLATGGSYPALAYSTPGINISSLFLNTLVFTTSDSDSGGVFGVNANAQDILPTGYVSGTTLNSSSIFLGTTLADLGLLNGSSYTYNYGTGLNADSIVFNVGAPVPEPASMALVGAGLFGLVASRRRKV